MRAVIKILSLFKTIVIFACLFMVDTISHNINDCNFLSFNDLNSLSVERKAGLCASSQNMLKQMSEVTGIV